MLEAGILTEIRRDHERRGYLGSTIYKRHLQVQNWARWLGDRSVWTATADDINCFLDAKHLCARSRYTWLAGLHVFYQWAIESGHAAVDPTERIVRPRLRRQLPRPIPTADLRVALSCATPMMRCWLLLAAYQGLRCQEVAGLRYEDVLFADHLLRIVHAKGGHERVVPMHPEVEAALRALPRTRSGWMFERPRGGKFSPNWVSSLVSQHMQAVGVRATAHQLRHWFGTELYRGTHDLRVVQEMLGHSTPQTTAIYTAFDHRTARAGIAALAVEEPLDAA